MTTLDLTGPLIVIPAFEPGQPLVDLVAELRSREPDLRLLVVDDGSGGVYDTVFAAVAALGARVERYADNRGKGYALRHAFALAAADPAVSGVVCADADGQHRVEDILRVRDRVANGDSDLVLGARSLGADAPVRSRFGNAVSRQVFAMSTGRVVSDTQTGLRGYPVRMLPWLATVPGDHYEYEFSLLLRAAEQGLRIEELPIATVYAEGNAMSHFRTVVDSARVYLPLLRFGASSVLAFLLDTGLLVLLSAVTGSLLASVIGARVISSTVNFTLNRTVVFRHLPQRRLGHAAARYFGLAAGVVALNYALLDLLHTELGVALLVAKIVTEVTVFTLSFAVQRLFVFTSRRGVRTRPEPVPVPVR